MAEATISYHGPIVTRDEARAAGHKRFFTGKSCTQGHVAERYASTKGCVECAAAARLGWAAANGERVARYNAAYKADPAVKARHAAREAERYGRQAEEINSRRRRKRLSDPSCRERERERRRAYRLRNRDRFLEAERLKRADPRRRQKAAATSRQWYAANKKRAATWYAAYSEANPGIVNALSAKRRAALRNQMPRWADSAAIRDFYDQAAEITRGTGIRHVVDHVIPLCGKTVCGLHVETNLRVVTFEENAVKYNKLDESLL